MPKQGNGKPNITDRPPHKETRARARSLWLQFGKLRHALPVGLIAVAALISSLVIQKAFANPATEINTTITSSLATNAQAGQSPKGMTWTLSANTTLDNTKLVAHIHIGNCMGDKILAMQSVQTDGQGHVDWGSNWFSNDVNGRQVWTTIPSNSWFLNIHDADAQDTPSIACIPILLSSPGNYWAVQAWNTNTFVSLQLVVSQHT